MPTEIQGEEVSDCRRLADAIRGLASIVGGRPEPQAPGVFEVEPNPEDLAGRLGVELWPVRLRHGEVDEFLHTAGPAVLFPVGEPHRWVTLVGGGGRWSTTLENEGRRKVRTVVLRDLLTGEARRAAAADARVLVDGLNLSPSRLDQACFALADERLQDQTAVEGWRLVLPPGASLRAQLRNVGAIGKAALLLLGHGLSTLLLIMSWWMIGRGALEGHLDRGWLWAWALLLVSTIPLRGLVGLTRGSLAWQVGALIKRRLLYGALRLRVEEVRGKGAGEWLGRVIDSERVEALAMNGGFRALLAGLELVLAATVLMAGSAPGAHLAWLVACCIVLAAAGATFHHRLSAWTRLRLGMTHRLVERLVGHRTRVVQEPRAHRHLDEDHELETYARDSAVLDGWLPRLQVLLPRIWLIVALAVLVPAALGGGVAAARLTVSLGGILLAFGALRAMTAGVVDLAAAAIAWGNVEPLFKAAARPRDLGSPAAAVCAAEQIEDKGEPSPMLQVAAVGFRHGGRDREVVRDVSLDISSSDRILIEGPSGGGKSTLISLLAGLRRPSRGWLGLHGLDLAVWGQEPWRRRVVCVPQAHENHLVTAPLAFNLLMGSRWPATATDLDAARQVCRELGLGPLLERMPSGIMQPVGDSGWQLSQGERLRVYLARALLQNAELVIFDESFAGLDLETLALALACADRRAKSLVVIAHP